MSQPLLRDLTAELNIRFEALKEILKDFGQANHIFDQ